MQSSKPSFDLQVTLQLPALMTDTQNEAFAAHKFTIFAAHKFPPFAAYWSFRIRLRCLPKLWNEITLLTEALE